MATYLCSKLEGIDPEKLLQYRTTYLVASFGLISFLLFRKSLGNLREFFGQIVYPPPPSPGKNCPYAYECTYKEVQQESTEQIIRYGFTLKTFFWRTVVCVFLFIPYISLSHNTCNAINNGSTLQRNHPEKRCKLRCFLVVFSLYRTLAPFRYNSWLLHQTNTIANKSSRI